MCRKVSDFVALRLYTKLLFPSMVSVGTFFFPSPRNQRVDHRFRFHKWESSQLAQFFPQLRRVCRVKQCAGTYSCKPLYLVANFFRFLLFPLFYSFSMGQIIFVSVSSIVFSDCERCYHCVRVKLTMSLNRYFQYVSVYGECVQGSPPLKSVVGYIGRLLSEVALARRLIYYATGCSAVADVSLAGAISTGETRIS